MRTDLREYIQKAVKKGHTPDEIKAKLIVSKYSEDEIIEALRFAGLAKLSYLSRLKTLITQPTKLFELVKEEQGIGHPFRFLLITFLLYGAIVSLIFATMVGNRIMMEDDYEIELPYTITIPLIIVGTLISATVASFITAGIYHLIAKIFKGNGTYIDTYKAIAYSTGILLPGSIISFVPIIGGLLAAAWIIVVTILGIKTLHSVTTMRATVITLLPTILALIAFAALFASLIFLAPELPPPPALPGTVTQSCDRSADPDSCYSELAQQQNDISLCARVTDADRQSFCIAAIASNNYDLPACELAPEPDDCYDSYVLFTKDPAACERIQSQQRKETCEAIVRYSTEAAESI